MRRYLELFWSFFKIGAFTFGGGYTMLPLIQKEIVNKRKWATEEEVIDVFALSQVAPGAIAVNFSVYTGHSMLGIPGALAAVFGMVLPSFLVISIIAAFLANFADLPAVQHAFAGIRVAVGALILDALIRLLRGVFNKPIPLVICIIAFLASVIFRTSPIPLVLAAGLAGFFLLRKRKAS